MNLVARRHRWRPAVWGAFGHGEALCLSWPRRPALDFHKAPPGTDTQKCAAGGDRLSKRETESVQHRLAPGSCQVYQRLLPLREELPPQIRQRGLADVALSLEGRP